MSGIGLGVQANVCFVNWLFFFLILRRLLVDYILCSSLGPIGDLLFTICTYSFPALIATTLGNAFSRNGDIASLTLLITT